MHPQLSDKRIFCQDIIRALEECHSDSLARFTGGCNKLKDELNECLRTERATRASKNRELAKERKARTEQALKEFNAE